MPPALERLQAGSPVPSGKPGSPHEVMRVGSLPQRRMEVHRSLNRASGLSCLCVEGYENHVIMFSDLLLGRSNKRMACLICTRPDCFGLMVPSVGTNLQSLLEEGTCEQIPLPRPGFIRRCRTIRLATAHVQSLPRSGFWISAPASTRGEARWKSRKVWHDLPTGLSAHLVYRVAVLLLRHFLSAR